MPAGRKDPERSETGRGEMSVQMAGRERRRIVALPANREMSNGALARELGVSEGTIRRDRKILAMALSEPLRPTSWQPQPEPEIVPTLLSWDRPRDRSRILNAAARWIGQQDLSREHVSLIVFRARGCLTRAGSSCDSRIGDPEAIIEMARPRNHNWRDLNSYADWLVAWLNCCLPDQRSAQVDLLERLVPLAGKRESVNAVKAQRARKARRERENTRSGISRHYTGPRGQLR